MNASLHEHKMRRHKKRILIGGYVKGAEECGRLLVKEGFEIVHTRQVHETRLEWLYGSFYAAIILDEEHLAPCVEHQPLARVAKTTRPVIYKAGGRKSFGEQNGACIFPLSVEETSIMILETLRALIRRIEGYPYHVRYIDFGLDLTHRKVSHNGKPLVVSRKQFDLLAQLVIAQGALIEPAYLYDQVWPDEPFNRRRLATQISLLRGNLLRNRIPMVILNRKNHGYTLRPLSQTNAVMRSKRSGREGSES